jgi:hypothetical protein
MLHIENGGSAEIAFRQRALQTNSAIYAVINSIDRNIQGAARESGEIDKVLKGTTGISVKDIKKHGVFGGPNSVFRKPFG